MAKRANVHRAFGFLSSPGTSLCCFTTDGRGKQWQFESVPQGAGRGLEGAGLSSQGLPCSVPHAVSSGTLRGCVGGIITQMFVPI